MQVVRSGGSFGESSSLARLSPSSHLPEPGSFLESGAYVLWPSPFCIDGSAVERNEYFRSVQRSAGQQFNERPDGRQAVSISDLLTIRAVHSTFLRLKSFGTAVGFRLRRGQVTDIPAVIVFVPRKLHKQWLFAGQLLPDYLVGPGGIWCDLDVIEFSYSAGPMVTPKEQIYNEEVESLRGNDSVLGAGSQVASAETYGTMGGLVRSRGNSRHVGFITNRHVSVDLDYPFQKIYHPLPPNLGPGVYLGAVERAATFVTDTMWYGQFASSSSETFVRVDGAFIPFAESFDTTTLTTVHRGIDGDVGPVYEINTQHRVGSIIGKRVTKVGRSSGPTSGTIIGYALHYSDEKGIAFLTDFLVIGHEEKPFDLEGDSGSMILMQDCGLLRPIGMVWGGTSNRGRLKFTSGCSPINWTSAIDLGRMLSVLQLDLLNTEAELDEALDSESSSDDGEVGVQAPLA